MSRLPLDDPHTDILRRVQAALIARFGRMERPVGKRRSPEWTLVQGVIGARTKTALSNAATDRMLADFASWEAVAGASVEAILPYLTRQSFPEQSARRLKACLEAIVLERGAVDLRHLSNLPTDMAMTWLETLPGVARKISAGVMNASVFERRALVIDSHHRRIVQRLGLVPPKADIARTFDALMPILPDEWSAADVDEHHLLLKTLGQTHCRPSFLDCAHCPLQRDCTTGRAQT